MTYLLGFPTPVIELWLLLVVFVLGCALYFGYKFEPPAESAEPEQPDDVPVDNESAGREVSE